MVLTLRCATSRGLWRFPTYAIGVSVAWPSFVLCSYARFAVRGATCPDRARQSAKNVTCRR